VLLWLVERSLESLFAGRRHSRRWSHV